MVSHMKATLVFREKRIEADGAIIDMTIWRVPVPVLPSPHRLKYSLYYGRGGQRLIGFDNERGKGDHMHVGDDERVYAFSTVEQLIADFLQAIATMENAR